jgi:hypothetical protein
MHLNNIYQMVYHLDCDDLVINHDPLVNINDRFFLDVESNREINLSMLFLGGDINFSLNIDLNYNSKLNLKLFSITNSKININVNHLSNNGCSNIKEICISQNSVLIELNTTAHIKPNTVDNSTNEELIGLICDNGNVVANPILAIDTDSCSAHHSSTIGTLDKNMIYYLMSRGIDEIEAKSLIIDGYKNQVIGEI